MYRITKVLNHNSVLAIDMENQKECLIMGKGAGFGKKPGERVGCFPNTVTAYELAQTSDHGNPRDLVRRIDPLYLAIADRIVAEAQKVFGSIDTSILIPMADHIAFAAQRVRKNAPISNPLTTDIRALFPQEFQVAETAREIIRKQAGGVFSDDELGYIALHIHSSLESMQVSQAMQTARIIRECVEMVQKETGISMDISSLSYNRLMTHIKYMAARILKGEKLHVDVNHIMKETCPRAFHIAGQICRQLQDTLQQPVDEIEVGYLAMHIERVFEMEQQHV